MSSHLKRKELLASDMFHPGRRRGRPIRGPIMFASILVSSLALLTAAAGALSIAPACKGHLNEEGLSPRGSEAALAAYEEIAACAVELRLSA
jgi:hypothetical protein